MAIAPELARIYASAPVDEDYLETLTLSHPLFSRTFYFTNKPTAFDARLENGTLVTFEPFPFVVKLPSANGSGQQDLGIAIDNVDRTIGDELERASGDPTETIAATYRVYASSDLSAPGNVPIALSISSVALQAERVDANAARTDVLNKRFPAVLYDVRRFPGLDR